MTDGRRGAGRSEGVALRSWMIHAAGRENTTFSAVQLGSALLVVVFPLWVLLVCGFLFYRAHSPSPARAAQAAPLVGGSVE